MSLNKKEEIDYEEYESLKQSRFKQQKLPGWRVLPSMFNAMSFFFSIGILCIGVGIPLFIFSDEIVRYEIDFSNSSCTNLNITKKMKANIMVYYKVYNFYQNNRRYMYSKSLDQLCGKNFSVKEMRNRHECDPIVTNKDLGIDNKTKKFNDDDIAVPCGLVAKSFKLFNDTYTLQYTNGTNIKINSTNIARKYDRENYKNSINPSSQWLDIEDEHFMVWMRIAPFSNFTKFYGRIEEDIDKGSSINVCITHGIYYDKEEYNQSEINKTLILTTVNSFGVSNNELAITFGGVGALCIILGIIFIFAFKFQDKKDR